MQLGPWVGHLRSRPSPREVLLFVFVALFVLFLVHPRSTDAFSSYRRLEEERDDGRSPSSVGYSTSWCDGDNASLWPGCEEGKTQVRRSFSAQLVVSRAHHLLSRLLQRFAYVQYATTTEYLCNSLIAFTRLRRLGTKAELALLHPMEWNDFVRLTPLARSLVSFDLVAN